MVTRKSNVIFWYLTYLCISDAHKMYNIMSKLIYSSILYYSTCL